MSARAVRRIVIAVCVLGIAGMIFGSVIDDNGVAMTFGIITAIAVLCLMVATAVTAAPGSAPGVLHVAAAGGPDDVEEQGALVEQRIAELVDAGGDEAELRALVGEAVRLGRTAPRR